MDNGCIGGVDISRGTPADTQKPVSAGNIILVPSVNDDEIINGCKSMVLS
jgi:hypothetical protein